MNKYKVGDKIVLTVSDVNEKAYYSYYVFNNNDLILWEPSTDNYAEPLSTYTEPLETKIENLKKKLKRWVEKCTNQSTEITRLLAENERLKPNYENIRAKGQNEAWELARKIALLDADSGYSNNELKEIFGSICLDDIFNLTYTSAAEKVEAWEKAKEEIKVGDVLEDMASSKVKCVVTNIYPGNMAYLVFNDGSAGMHELENMKKTGRHIDIDSFLKQIGEE